MSSCETVNVHGQPLTLSRLIECQQYYHDPCILYISQQCGLTGDMAEKIQTAHKRSPRALRPSEESLLKTSILPQSTFIMTTQPIFEELSLKTPVIRIPTLDDFRIISVIGKGNFGKVS